MNNSVSAIIPAAGVGKRFSENARKQFFNINGKSILYYTLKNLKNSYSFKEFLIGSKEEDFNSIQDICDSLKIDNYKLVIGGKERFDTVYNCLIVSSGDFVLIHDAVRPFINKNIVSKCINLAFNKKAAICGITPRDTIKEINYDSVEKTIDRNKLILAHTPQVFEKTLLKNALEFQRKNSDFITDEAMAIEKYGHKVFVSDSSYNNIKLTKYEDLLFFKYLISNQEYLNE